MQRVDANVRVPKWVRVPTSAFRTKSLITVVILHGDHEKLECLKAGTLLIPTSGPDAAGIVTARFGQSIVLVFERDLEEACELTELGVAKSSCAS